MGVIANHAHRERQRHFGRVFQHRPVGTYDQRQIGVQGRIACDEIGGILVGRGIEQMMRLAVARQEILQPRHVAKRCRPDQHRAAGAALDQADPAQDQRAHDALAQFGFRDQQRAQLLRRDQKRFDIALGMAVDQRDAAGKLADLGQKLSRALVDDRSDMAEAVTLGDGDVAGEHDEHPRPHLAGLEQRFAGLVGAQLPETAHAGDFVMGERRECLFVTRKRGGSRADRRTGRDVCTHCRRPK